MSTKRIWQGYVALIENLCLIGISLVAVLGGLQVWFRYVAGNSLVWSEEVMRFTMIWTVMLGAGLAYSRRQFLGMRFVVDALPAPLRRFCDLLSAAAMLTFLGVIIWYGWKFSIKTQLQLSPTLGFSLFWVNVSIVVGAVLLCLHVILVEFMGVHEPDTLEVYE